MIEDDDIDGLAGEYVLGCMDAEERKVVDARRKTDAKLSEAIAAWERRLAPLSYRVPAIEPPSDAFPDILARISRQGGRATSSGQVVAMVPRSRRWGLRVVGAGALAACVVLVVGWLLQGLPGTPTAFIAELHRGAGATSDEILGANSSPAFVVTVDLKAREFKVRPVAARPAPRRSYQLWLIPQGSTTPLSLGVISQAAPSAVAWPAGYPAGDLTNATLAVSLEPESGPPSKAPTGPIVFTGKLLPAAS